MRIVLCDDNSKERDIYSKIVKDIATEKAYEIELVMYENAKQLLFEMEDQANFTDLLLLDINMPEITGVEAADRLRNMGYEGEIVFLTVSKEHMLNAFDVRAYNYIVKGETTPEKTKKILEGVMALASEKQEEYMLFTGVGEYRNIPIASIKYFEVNQKVVTVHYGKEEFEFVSTIGKLENLLFPKGFIRIHRSFMVASSAIKSFTYEEAVLNDGTRLPIGRKYYALLKETMGKAKV